MPYISYECYQNQIEYDKLLRTASLGTSSPPSQDGSSNSGEDSIADLHHLGRKTVESKEKMECESIIQGYLNYGQKPYDLPLHPRR
jgi:hypothetical protein